MLCCDLFLNLILNTILVALSHNIRRVVLAHTGSWRFFRSFDRLDFLLAHDEVDDLAVLADLEEALKQLVLPRFEQFLH